MRIVVKRDGGIAYIPGLNRPRVLDTEQLEPAVAEELRRNLDAARFFEQPAQVGRAQPGAADLTSVTLTVEDGDRHHTITLVDPIEDPALRALRDAVHRAERSLGPRRSGSPPGR